MSHHENEHAFLRMIPAGALAAPSEEAPARSRLGRSGSLMLNRGTSLRLSLFRRRFQ